MNEPIPSESIAVEDPNSEPTPEPQAPEETPSDGTPAEPTAEVTPEAPEAINPEAAPADQLFELPDGRQVDGITLAKEWKENFLPDYTQKSQKLAEIERGNLPKEEAPVNPYADPDYVPTTYEEIIAAAEERALARLDARESERTAAQQAAEDAVIEQLEAVKKLDANVDENKLFLHATKYGFRDLPTAYQNMKDMGQITKTVQKQTIENINKRKDPVSVQPGGNVGTAPDPSGFESAVDFMRSLKT